MIFLFIIPVTMFNSTPTKDLSTIRKAVDRTTYNAGHFHTVPANATDFLAKAALLDETARNALTPKERISFHAKAIEGIQPPFAMINDLSTITDPSKFSGSDFFSKSLDFTLQFHTLKQQVGCRLMQSVFYDFNVEERRVALTGGRCLHKRYNNMVSLLEYYSSIDLNTVLLSSEYYATYSDWTIDAENMQWSQELILNSCDDELKHYLMSRMSLIQPEQQGGPTMCMIMVEKIVSNNEHLSRALILRLNSSKISTVPGENIEQASAFIKSVCTRLDTCQKLPPHAERIVFDIMTTCSVERFKQHFQTFQSSEV
jgi:hypothetical protein